MKKILLISVFSLLLFFISASYADNDVMFLIKEATLGRPVPLGEVFQIEVQNLADFSVAPMRQRSTLFGNNFSLPNGDYRVRVTNLEPGAAESNYTAREFTFHIDETWDHQRKDLYLQRRDQSFLNLKIQDAGTRAPINNATVIIGYFADDRENSIFRTAPGGVVMGPEVNTGEQINAAPGSRFRYRVTAPGYLSVTNFINAAPRGGTLDFTINLSREAGVLKSSPPPPSPRVPIRKAPASPYTLPK